jgi:hypothetical protein
MKQKAVKHEYSLNTGLVQTHTQKFKSEKEAWNVLAKELDARYKTGGKVIALLERYGEPIYNIHEKQGLDNHHALSKQYVAVGYTSYDWDGVPWNNPTYCGLCKCPITSQRFRDYGYCGECMPVINSIWAWNPTFKTMHSKERKPAKITQKQLDCLKEFSEDRWKDADFLIRDGTLTLVEENAVA